MTSCAIMILNFNGADWLRLCLPSVIAAVQQSALCDVQIWVVDNNSSDQSRHVCTQQSRGIRFEALSNNTGLAAYNIAAQRCDSEILVLLNNDLVVDRDFLRPLVEALSSGADVFAASAQIRSYPPRADAPVQMGATVGVWSRGMLRASPRAVAQTDSTFFVSGGAMACWRERFLSLGGFDRLFFPGYHEDVDLSWRAWKHGWRCLHVPQAQVYHAGGATMGPQSSRRSLMARNQFLFHWKNLQQLNWVIRHAVWLVPRLLGAIVSDRSFVLRGFLSAIGQLPATVRQRHRVSSQARLSDHQALLRAKASTVEVRSPLQSHLPVTVRV